MTEPKKRILLYTGKGGVGKTSSAAATALCCAERGYRTIVLSTDPAHSLGDSFDVKLGPEPTLILPNLWAQEIDIYYSIDKHWARLQTYLAAVFTWQGANRLLAEEVAAIPGMEEGSSLLWIQQHYDSNDYDVIVVDCAPTAETLRLLSLPDTGRWWFARFAPLGKRAGQMLGPLARVVLSDMPLPDQETIEEAETLFAQLRKLHDLLLDPTLASMRLVINPEKMVIKEAQRTYTYLNLYGYVTDAVIVNRILPPTGDPYFASWRETQQRYLSRIEEGFSPLPLLKAPYFEGEVVGPDALRRMGVALFGDEDPARLMSSGQAHTVEPTEEGYMLKLALPFITRQEVSLLRSGDELTVQVGNWRRNIVLPRALVGMEVQGAKFSGDHLHIRFVTASDSKPA